MGSGRSGTTLLGTILSIHRQIGFLNEPKALWHSVFGQEDIVGSYFRGPSKVRLEEKDVTFHVQLAAQRIFGAYLSMVERKG